MTENELCLERAEYHRSALATGGLAADLLVEHGRYVGAPDADIGEQTIVERHQLIISVLALDASSPRHRPRWQ